MNQVYIIIIIIIRCVRNRNTISPIFCEQTLALFDILSLLAGAVAVIRNALIEQEQQVLINVVNVD